MPCGRGWSSRWAWPTAQTAPSLTILRKATSCCRRCARHKVTARHGDAFDPLSFEGDRDLSGLSDAIALDLVGRFVIEVEQNLGHELPDAAILALREIDNFRPLLLIPAWIEGVLGTDLPAAGRAEAREAVVGPVGRRIALQPPGPRARCVEFGKPDRRALAGPAVQQAAFGGLGGSHERNGCGRFAGPTAIPLPAMP